MRSLCFSPHSAQFKPFSSRGSRCECPAAASTSGRPCSSCPTQRGHTTHTLWTSPATPRSDRRSRLVAAATDYGEAYDNLFRSKVFQSEVVVREFDSIMTELRQLSMMASKFPDFDLPGKEMFLDKMEENTERYKLFMKRLELCDDPAAKEYLRYTTAQMMEAGFNFNIMMQGLQQSLQQYRHWVAEERRVSSDPVKHQQFLAAMKRDWASSALGAIDMSVLSRLADPQVVAEAQKHPEFYKAIKEISDNPSNEVIMKWMEHKQIGPLVQVMWKTMQMQRMQQQG